MTPERWKKLDALFHEALELQGGARAAHLAKVCGDDEQLRAEVEKLIAAHERESSFIDSPIFVEDAAQSPVGRRIGHYQIVSLLGRGGMGEVYLGEDSRLERKVALKMLPAAFTQHPNRVRRFEREAKAASALNHPNILTIHEIGEVDGAHYIVSEFVEGETVRVLIERGRSGINEAITIANQIAGALSVAHEAGIIHRDIKPENVMVRPDGLVKVLDFGLAKLTERSAASSKSEAGSPEMTVARLSTEPGVVMGTAQYMSPEQARGLKVDHRTDIFSLGVMVYEMIAGRWPFEGETASDVIAAILQNEPPPLSQLRPESPPELEQIVSRMLSKERDARYHSAAELRTELQRLQRKVGAEQGAGDTVETPTVTAASRAAKVAKLEKPAVVTDREQTKRQSLTRRSRQVTVIGLVALILAAAGIVWRLTRPSTSGPGPILTRLTSDSGLTIDPALSWDGKMLAYASDRSGDGNLDIWVKQVVGGEPLRLTRDEADEREPTFSPDGSQIAFRSERDGGGIYIVSALSGEARLIASRGRTPSFSPDGQQIAYWSGDPQIYSLTPTSWLYVVSSTGGPPRQLQPDFTAVRSPIWSPDGTRLLFLGFNPKAWPADKDPDLGRHEMLDWWVTPLSEGAATKTGAFSHFRRQFPDLSPPFQFAQVWGSGLSNYTPQAWLPEKSTVLFSARLGDSTNIWKIPFSPKTWQVNGLPQRVTFGTGQEAQPSVAATGQLVFSNIVSNTDVWSLPIQANRGKVIGEAQRLTQDTARDYCPSVSADGKTLVFLSERSENTDLWKKDLESGKETALTATPFNERYPVITDDGTKVACVVLKPDRSATYVFSVHRGGSEKIRDGWYRPEDWTSDGKWMLGTFPAKEKPNRDWVGLFDVFTQENTEPLQPADWSLLSPRFSPDERWIAFHTISNPTTRRIFIAPFLKGRASGESEWIAVTGGSEMDREPRWSPDGNLIYFISERDGFRCLWAQRLKPMSKRPVGSPFAVYHLHRCRLTNRMGDTGLIGLSFSRNKVFLSLEELTGNIWMAKLDQ